jgi:hypothetical protein
VVCVGKVGGAGVGGMAGIRFTFGVRSLPKPTNFRLFAVDWDGAEVPVMTKFRVDALFYRRVFGENPL